MSLKDIIEQDLNIFFNTDEFATIHNIGGREFPIVMDNDRLSQLTKKDYDGLYIGDLLFYVSALELGTKPKPGNVILFDEKPYIIFDAKEDDGIYEIILKASES